MRFATLAPLVTGMAVTLTSCFTGIESTPKITQRDVERQVVSDSPERHILDSVHIAPPSEWHIGKRFYITDNRAGRGLWRVTPIDSASSLGGRTARLTAIDTVTNLTGDVEVELAFALDDSPVTMLYRTGITNNEWAKRISIDVPYFIDLDIVDDVATNLVGKTYYILVARRLTETGTDTVGRRYDPVHITAVEPGNDVQPLLVRFTDNDGRRGAVLMTLGNETTSRRNFETLFAIGNPRERYKQISDTNWELIRNSRIALGMTPLECRLALGSPDQYLRIPTTAGMAERWSYTNGTYLLFEDGLLAAFR